MAFGETGSVATDILATGNEYATAVAVQGNGKIVAAGNGGLARYNSDGTLDAGFNAASSQPGVFPEAQDGDTYYDVALQADGKIVAVGERFADHWDFFLTRWNADGTLDSTFGTNGHVTLPAKSSTTADVLRSVAIQDDGKIVVVGGDSFQTGWYVLRFLPDGKLDKSFDRDGKLTTTFGTKTGNPTATDVVVQPDGKILVAGKVSFYPTSSTWRTDFAVVRYNSNGSLDTSFGQGGKVRTSFAEDVGQSLSRDQARSIALQADGKIVVGGETAGGVYYTSPYTALARYNTNGDLDSTFGGDGRVTRHGGNGHSLAVQADGKIVVGHGVTVERYNANGNLDASFDGDGLALTYSDQTQFYVNGIRGLALQNDGKIVVAGLRNSDEPNLFAVGRLNSDGSPDAAVLALGEAAAYEGAALAAVDLLMQQGGVMEQGGVASQDDWAGVSPSDDFESVSTRRKPRR